MKTNRRTSTSSRSCLELLEPRIAPAAILTFTDVDGDVVKVSSDKAIAAKVSFTATGNPASIDVTGPGLDGASLAFTVTKSAIGDGLVNIGRIVATGLDLGAVTVPGDLAKIVCGNVNNPLPGLKSLTAKSFGNFNVATQGGGDLYTVVTGDLGSLNVAGSVLGVSLQVTGTAHAITIGGDFRGDKNYSSARLLTGGLGTVKIGGDLVAGLADESGKIVCFGDLGSLKIGGSVRGALDAKVDLTGQIFVSGNAGPISIGGDIVGAVSSQKAVEVSGNAGAITVAGSIIAGAGQFSGGVYVGGNAGVIKIGHDIRGGAGDFSGQIVVAGTAAGFTVGHDVRGGSGSDFQLGKFGQILLGKVSTAVKIGGDIVGGTGQESAVVDLGLGAPSFTLGGSIIGGGSVAGALALGAGALAAGQTPVVTIGGDLVGGSYHGGVLFASSVTKLSIKGSIVSLVPVSNNVTVASLIQIAGDLGSATIGGSVTGPDQGSGVADATIMIGGNVGSLLVHGALNGGATTLSASIDIGGKAGTIKIGGSLHAGAGFKSGDLRVAGRIALMQIGGNVETNVVAGSFGTATVAGDVFGNVTASFNGFDFLTVGGSLISDIFGGTLNAVTTLGTLKIGGSVIGSSGLGDPNLNARSAGNITIGGDVVGGADVSPIFQFGGGVGAVTIGGDLRGPATVETRLVFNTESPDGRGFASLLVKGNVDHSFIGSGIHPINYLGKQPDSTVGSVTVGGNWIASSLVAGIGRGMDNLTGTADDKSQPVSTLSRIAAITIAGQVLGTEAAGDHFGFVAHSIGTVKIGGKTYTPGATPIELSPVTGDVTIRPV